MKKTILLSLFFILSYVALSQSVYYVDATSGSDNNSGTSPNLAWKSLDKVSAQKFKAGDIILFRRGVKWTGQLEINNIAGNEYQLITFGAYPETGGEVPVISTITEHFLSWTAQGGNIWKADSSPVYHPERLWVDGSEILRANKLSELDGQHFFWFYDAPKNGNLYLYSQTEPSSKKISYTSGQVPLLVDSASYLVFTNLNLQGGWTSVYINNKSSYIHFNEMQIGKYAANGIDINSENSAVPDYIHIKNCIFDAAFTLDYSMAAAYSGSDERGCSDAIFIQNGEYCEIDSNTFKNWGHASINIDGKTETGTEPKVSYISVHNNYLSSPDICYGGRISLDNAHHCEIFNNQIINTSVQCQFNGYNNHIHHNIIMGTKNPPIVSKTDEISAGIDVEGYAGTEVMNNIYENNLIINTEGVGIHLNTAGFQAIHDNIFRNNIIYNCGNIAEVAGIGIQVDSNTTEAHTRNNIFYNNLIYNADTSITIDFRGEKTDVSGFNALNGTSDYQIEENIAGNPLFVDVDNADYHLTDTSPCINAGTNTLATLDFEGNSIPYAGTAPDIGIYEYQHATSAIKNYLSLLELSVFPNPAKKFIHIKLPPALYINKIELFDMNGREIISQKKNTKTLDLSQVQAGTYFIEISTSLGKIRRTIVKIK